MKPATCHPERQHCANGLCRPCWRDAHRDKQRETERAYRDRRGAEINVAVREHYAANRDAINARRRAKYAAAKKTG
jgi:hypothetical protein